MSEYPNAHKVITKSSKSVSSSSVKFHECHNIASLYLHSELDVEYVEPYKGILYLYCRSSSPLGICPYCGSQSKQVHSRYTRKVHDLSILGEEVVLVIESRKFFCKNPHCSKKTFAEQPGNELFRYRRRTRRCEITVIRHGLSVSCGTASKLLSLSGIVLSRSTALRDLHRLCPPEYESIREIGVDDWAWRKGVTYGSIVIDPHGRYPIDVLGDREMDSFKNWMEKHKQVSMVSRDRSTDYSAAITATGRPVVEVADKFHLIKNISGRLMKTIGSHYDEYRMEVRKDEKEEVLDETLPVLPVLPKPAREDSRMVMFREVKELQDKGFKPTTISRKLGIARQTATKYCQMDELPRRNSKYRNSYHLYDRYVEEEVAKGKTLLEIYQDICRKGFKGSRTPFYDHYRHLSDGHRREQQKGFKTNKRKKPRDDRSALMSLKTISSIVDKSMYGHVLKQEEEKLIETLSRFKWFMQFYEAAKSFYTIITSNEPGLLIRWMKQHWKTDVPSLKTFLIGVKIDFKAVRNTIAYNITNGITEGFVNKLKVVKRIMYGRAGIELLRRKMVMEHVFFN